MNNFTETLPKSGHVTEVCKEWLVREDSALAYKLQSQEINDFYKGNRFRNAVVREDFPTAMHEQIKEREHADKQSEVYRRRLMEQEEHDKCVAKEIADKLERDLQEQQQRELHESEMIAQQMQQIYVNLPPVPPPASRHAGRPPPRPAKASNQHSSPPSTHERHSSSSSSVSNGRPSQAQTSHPTRNNSDSFQDGSYVSVSLAHGVCVEGSERYKQMQQQQQQQQQQHNGNHNHNNNSHLMTPMKRNASGSSSSGGISPTSPSSSSSSAAAVGRARNVLEPLNMSSPSAAPSALLTTSASSPSTPHTPNTAQAARGVFAVPPATEDDDNYIVEYSDVADSIRHYNIHETSSVTNFTSVNNNNNNNISSSTTTHSSLTRSTHSHQQRTSMSAVCASGDASDATASAFSRLSSSVLSPSSENLLRNENPKFQKLSPEKYDQMVGNGNGNGNGIRAAERHMQEHADDIELYVDPCDYASLKEIGLPMHEIKEMSKKLKQEQKDALLARRLQEMEAHDGLTQEERDRLLAIEAQDKELAKMLQEREKAKAKRAKEKSRLRKSQQKDSSSISSSSLCPSSVLHCGQILTQDCLSPSNSPHKVNASITPPGTLATNGSLPPHPLAVLDDPLDMEAYSNPIDVLHNSQQRMHTTGPLTNGSLTRDPARLSHTAMQQRVDDDIYTLPVDSCRPGQRPASLSVNGGVAGIGEMIQGNYHQNSMSRSENYSIGSHGSGGNDTAISNGSILHDHDVSPRINYTKSAAFDKSSSPTPPYMPIQGTRRSNSTEDRKKKSKDKCIHQ